jgi:hypothetical protein
MKSEIEKNVTVPTFVKGLENCLPGKMYYLASSPHLIVCVAETQYNTKPFYDKKNNRWHNAIVVDTSQKDGFHMPLSPAWSRFELAECVPGTKITFIN